MANARSREEKANAIINEILNEDLEIDATRTEACPGGCENSINAVKEAPRKCNCAVENSSRFSLRVMEAMRSLQRNVDQPSISSTEDIVEYIRENYRSDGDLDAQVRTALRQQELLSNRFVMKLLDDAYHFIGPIARPLKQDGCNLDCTGRTPMISEETSRRRKSIIDSRRNGCRCRTPYQRRDPRRDSLGRASVAERLEDGIGEPRLHSTRISINETDNAEMHEETYPESSSVCDCIPADVAIPAREIKPRDGIPSPIAGPARVVARTPASPENARKRMRVEDRTARYTDENDGESREEDVDCTCDVVQVKRNAYMKKPRLPGRARQEAVVTRTDRRNGRRDEDVEDEEETEDEEEEEEEKEEEDDTDTDTEDSAYRQLRRRSPRRTRARERELKRWIRRCREECERRRAR